MISAMETDLLKTYSEEGCGLKFGLTRFKTKLGLKYLFKAFTSRVYSDKQLGER